MQIETIFLTQVSTIIGFIIALFVLYRVLVKQKDSTIEALKEKNHYLELLLMEAEKKSPDILIETVSNRVRILTEEIERLNQDSEKNELLIEEKEKELSLSKNELVSKLDSIERSIVVGRVGDSNRIRAILTTENKYALSNMAHETRTILTVLAGLVEYLSDREDNDEEEIKYFKIINQNISGLQNVIGVIWALSKEYES